MICQHSSTEAPLTADIAVRLKAVIGFSALTVLLLMLLPAATNSEEEMTVSSDFKSMVSYISRQDTCRES